ncbi:hypothetical protein BC938DRAFT_483240 [Jimgerdemannia flammicorona]|uniref:Uncharacterized protein n=1 Tax=Jimgerdemannia flammicorona TaxID=994334 RepID=A0A433QW14_9FUNG|nr:hypothetical protein BC938DRAFT_483240 [Jimgerdemannia flammicorona]
MSVKFALPIGLKFLEFSPPYTSLHSSNSPSSLNSRTSTNSHKSTINLTVNPNRDPQTSQLKIFTRLSAVSCGEK